VVTPWVTPRVHLFPRAHFPHTSAFARITGSLASPRSRLTARVPVSAQMWDAAYRAEVAYYASEEGGASFLSDVAAAWGKLTGLGCDGLVPLER